MDPVTDQEADELTVKLKAIADQWRTRLADPATQQQLAAGTLAVSPLVKELLAAFPPDPKT